MTAPAGDGGDSAEQEATPTDQRSEFTPITSQEDLNKLFGQRLAQRERAIRAEYKGFDEMKSKAEQFDQLNAANQTELQRFQTERDAAVKAAEESASRAAVAEAAALRQRIAIEEGLPPKFASRLTGETEDELRADAKDTFGEFIKTPSFDHGPREQSAPQSMNDLIFGAAKRR